MKTSTFGGVVCAVAAALVISGCGAEVENASPSSGADAKVEVSNCSGPLSVPSNPSRALTNDTGITEMMFALGLQDRMVGYTTYEGKDRDLATSPWRQEFETTRSLGTAFTREVIQNADPDFVFAGWNYGFKESTGVTPDWIRAIGATPYQLTEACRQPGTTKRGIKRPLDALYDDIDNLGTIFGVRDRAASLVKSYRDEVSAASAKAPAADRRARVLLFDSADPAPFTAGRNAAPDQIISEAGGTNVFDDLNDSWTSVSWEAAAQNDPQVIVVVDYGAGPANTVQAKIAQLRAQPLMAGTTAVREGNFISFPYAALVESPRNPATITALASYLRGKGY
ncbi:ABC transporter substrate-binding protein [Williamsia phyllosphaerae]|uniref:Iron compound ABC transporter, substrate-binding protein n=1 Tax=Williamsia phyllosphaerae TaxID=885042 RepID=A0ABQ1V8K4_9NOCA|nr:ABC transporter substrate-binding protein [Williamsia phyllosphaerae]GGF44123.1 putative iron compound ABC transporter, substrate-binding protein [Williamsia phyllosphaerae]